MALALRPLPRLEYTPDKHDDLIIELSELPTVSSEPLTVQNSGTASTAETRSTNEITIATATTTAVTSTTEDTSFTHASTGSVLLKPTLFSMQKIHVSPDMIMNEELRTVWLGQIKEPLRIVLGHEIRTGSCVQEFMMAGRTSAHLKPTVVVTCGNAKVRTKVEKVFKSKALSWLRDLLKSNKIAFVALIHPAHLSVNEPDGPLEESHNTASFWLEEHQDNAWFCGRRIRFENGRVCVLGGILLLDDVPYALVAGHCVSHLHAIGPMSPASTNTAEQSSDIDDTTDDVDEDDDEPFWFGSDDESEESTQSSLTIQKHSEYHDNHDLDHAPASTSKTPSARELFEHVVVPVKWSSTLINAKVNVAKSSTEDWAMLRFDSLPRRTPNMIPADDSQPARQVSTFVAQEYKGNVQVVFAQHIYSGTVHASPCTVQIDSYSCTAFLVTMNHILPSGCSGSWVVANDQLVGHIIATREDIPWAYMIPIHNILESVVAIYKPDRIELPFKTISSKPTSPTAPAAPLAQIEASTGPIAISQPAAVLNLSSRLADTHWIDRGESYLSHRPSSPPKFGSNGNDIDYNDDDIVDGNRSGTDLGIDFPDTPFKRTIGIIVSLLLGLFIVVLDNSMVASIQPSIIQQYKEVSKLPWISVGYALGACAMNFVVSHFLLVSDTKWLFIMGLVVFEVGSAISGSTSSMFGLIFGRVISGMASDVVCVSGLSIASSMATTKRPALSIGVAGVTSSLPVFLGPLIGGAFAQHLDRWRWCFWLNLCLGGPSIITSFFLLPSLRPQYRGSLAHNLRNIEWHSNLSFAIALTFSMIGICFGGNIFRWSSIENVTFLSIAGAVWVYYIGRLYLSQRGLIIDAVNPFRVLYRPRMMGLFLQVAAGSAARYIVMYFIPMYSQFVVGQQSFASAVTMLPFLGTFVYTTGLSIFFTTQTRWFTPLYLLGGTLIVTGGSLLYTRLSPDMATSAFYGFTVLCGIGSGAFIQTTLTLARLISWEGDTPNKYIDAIRCGELLGTLFGLGISNTIFLNKAADRITDLVRDISRDTAQDFILGKMSASFQGTSDPTLQTNILNAISQSMRDVFTVVITAGAVVTVFVLLMRPGRMTNYGDRLDREVGRPIRYR